MGITFLYQDDGDAHIEVFNDGNRDVAAAQTKTFARGNSKQCIIIPAVEDGNGCSDNPADNRPCDRVFYLAVTPRSISPDPEDEKLDYALHVQNGEDCSVIPGDDGGAVWPRHGAVRGDMGMKAVITRAPILVLLLSRRRHSLKKCPHTSFLAAAERLRPPMGL